jgi:hypothetical protein
VAHDGGWVAICLPIPPRMAWPLLLPLLLAVLGHVASAQPTGDPWGGSLADRPGRGSASAARRWQDPPGFRWGVATAAYQVRAPFMLRSLLVCARVYCVVVRSFSLVFWID